MGKYSIVEGVNVVRQDIEDALELDKLVYEEDFYVSIEQCLSWYTRNNKIYTMIRDDETGKIIGYINASPVSGEYYERIRSGDFIDTYLPAEAIERILITRFI